MANRIASWSSVSEADAAEHELPRSPSSPSNSWSSAETAPLPENSPPGEGGEGRRPKRCKISREQLAVLIKSFDEEPLPNFDQRQNLAKLLLALLLLEPEPLAHLGAHHRRERNLEKCRSRKVLQNNSLVAIVAVHPAANEPLKISR